jgi:hypothetical protein
MRPCCSARSPGLLSRTAVRSALFVTWLLEHGLRVCQTVRSNEGTNGGGASPPTLVCGTTPTHPAETSEANRAWVCQGVYNEGLGVLVVIQPAGFVRPCLFWSGVGVKSAPAKYTFPHQLIRKQVTPLGELHRSRAYEHVKGAVYRSYEYDCSAGCIAFPHRHESRWSTRANRLVWMKMGREYPPLHLYLRTIHHATTPKTRWNPLSLKNKGGLPRLPLLWLSLKLRC